MPRHRYALAIVVTLWVIPSTGCNPRNQAQAEFTPSTDRIATAHNDTLGLTQAIRTPEPARAAPTAAGRIEISLAPYPQWTVGGGADLSPYGEMTAVHLTIADGMKGVHYGVDIRRGSCEHPGAVVAGLPPVSADSLGRGSAASHAEIAFEKLRALPHIVVLSVREVRHACGALPAAGSTRDPAAAQ